MGASKAGVIGAAKALDLGAAREMLALKPELLQVTDRNGMNLPIDASRKISTRRSSAGSGRSTPGSSACPPLSREASEGG